jgi:hypothetical protein
MGQGKLCGAEHLRITIYDLRAGWQAGRMTWKEAGILLDRQVGEVLLPLPNRYWENCPHWEQRVRKLFAEEERLRAEAEEIVLRFCTGGGWRIMLPGSLSLLVMTRVLAGSATAQMLAESCGVVREYEGPDSKLLIWLLRDCWNAWRWDEYLKMQALASYGGPLYAAPELPNYEN